MSAASLDREKLVRVLGMLGSAHQGEIAAAGRAADKMVREAGLRWPDIIPPALPAPRRASAPHAGRDPDHQIAFLLDHPDFLSEWEAKFITSIGQLRQRRRRLSTKQLAVLQRIFDEVRQTASGAAA